MECLPSRSLSELPGTDDSARPSLQEEELTAEHREEALQAARHAEAMTPRSCRGGPHLSADERLVQHYLRAHLSSKTPLLQVMIAEADDSWHRASAADAAVAAVAKVRPAPPFHHVTIPIFRIK